MGKVGTPRISQEFPDPVRISLLEYFTICLSVVRLEAKDNLETKIKGMYVASVAGNIVSAAAQEEISIQ